MPQPINLEQREVVYLHAPWWSAETREASRPVVVLERRPKATPDDDEDLAETVPAADTDDDDEEWVGVTTRQVPVEHITLYRQVTHKDTKWVSQRASLFAMRSNGAPKLKEAELARMRTLSYVRRCTEITTATGEKLDISEALFDSLPESDLQYLAAAIEALDDPVAPILHEDRAHAAKKAAEITDLKARGFPVREQEEIDEEAYAAATAHDRLFRVAEGDL